MPRFSASGSFAGVYGVSSSVAAGGGEEANYVGAVMVFQQTAAPTGWTKITTDDDAILTATTGSLTTGGTLGFASAFTNVSLSGSASGASATISAASITAPQLASHNHAGWVGYSGFNPRPGSGVPGGIPPEGLPWPFWSPGSIRAPYTGPTSHTHPNPPGPFSSAPAVFFTKDLRIKYVDVIIASKD